MGCDLDCSLSKVNCNYITANLYQSISCRDNDGAATGMQIAIVGKQYGGLAAG